MTLRKSTSIITRLLSIFFLLAFTFNLAAKDVQAGAVYCYDNGFQACAFDGSINPNPDCTDEETDPCASYNDYNECCQTLSGEYDQGGGLLLNCNPIACIPLNVTPPPSCSSGWECIRTSQDGCNSVHGTYTSCLLDSGETGTCCDPPTQPSSACSFMDGWCRIPDNQTIPGQCEWNEYPLPESCHSSFPQGTLCCVAAPIITCGPGGPQAISDGYCTPESECTSPDGIPYGGWTNCLQNGEVCCLPIDYVPNPTPTPYIPPIYCAGDTPEEGSTNHPPDPENPKLWTSIGCVSTLEVGGFTVDLLSLGLGIGGGLALLIIAISGIMINTSAGNPQRAQIGRDLAFAAIAALMLMTFSAFILRFVGIRTLHIPGL